MTVTGSVADRVAPSCKAIGRDNADRDSSPILVHNHTSRLQLEYAEADGVPNDDCRDECSCKGKCKDTPDVSEEIGLMSITAVHRNT